MMKFLYCVVFSIFLTVAYCDSKFANVVKKPPSKEEFDMFINEQGWKYTEKLTFDMTKKTIVHHVPAHRDLTESHVMDDFVSNTTVTRILNQRVCYIRPKSPKEPSLDVLKESIEKASSEKYKMKDGFKKIATQWIISGQADMSKLSKEVIEFCGGMEIYEVKEHVKDGVKTTKAISREKRNNNWVLCKPLSVVKKELEQCDRSQWTMKCKLTAKHCFHYVTCISIAYVRGQCSFTYNYDDFVCCTPSCP